MKKIILKKEKLTSVKSNTYKIDYFNELNNAQYEAVMHNFGPALVIAGAGTGKTRTLIYRLARLIEDGNNPESILLLSFTRKSASEMLRRAALLLDGRCEQTAGGTFHSFAVMVLRFYAKMIGYDTNFTILDQSDSEDVINIIRSEYITKNSERRFPNKRTLHRIYSMGINTKTSFDEIIEDYFPVYSNDCYQINDIINKYELYKRNHNVMDYDDLLINLYKLLKEHKKVLQTINQRYRFVMVDEYQDTNKIQHDIVLLLAGAEANVMAVGDDAQSIYSFRGASFQNIMFFPESFANCKIYKIEENYRSTNQILNLSNEVIHEAEFKYEKRLFSRISDGQLPYIISTKKEREQSEFLVQQILELRENDIPLNDIAVLFRSGFHSFDLEIELKKANIGYRKFGGLKFMETSHIKDLVAFMRILYNPKEALSWHRILTMLEGIGPKKATSVIEVVLGNNLNLKKPDKEIIKKFPEKVVDLMEFLTKVSNDKITVSDKCALISEYYRPILKIKHDDWRKRWEDISTFITISERYNSLQSFLNDLAIEPPTESVAELSTEVTDEETLTLSTIHSAKGLEWQAVFVIWALEGRFPSAKSAQTIDDIEEERRLFYVAVTRAKRFLYITYPSQIYDRESGMILSSPSRFISKIPDDIVDRWTVTPDDDEETKDFNNFSMI